MIFYHCTYSFEVWTDSV